MPPFFYILTMSKFQTNKLTDYLVSKILRNNVASGVISSDMTSKISEIKAKLEEEVAARFCVIPLDSMTFNELVEAVESQIDITDFIN